MSFPWDSTPLFGHATSHPLFSSTPTTPQPPQRHPQQDIASLSDIITSLEQTIAEKDALLIKYNTNVKALWEMTHNAYVLVDAAQRQAKRKDALEEEIAGLQGELSGLRREIRSLRREIKGLERKSRRAEGDVFHTGLVEEEDGRERGERAGWWVKRWLKDE
jgi:predicted  nucleic acid-binding Zn-ribbon protein